MHCPNSKYTMMHKSISIYCGLCREIFVSEFELHLDYTKCNEIYINFYHARKYVNNGMIIIHNLSTGSHKKGFERNSDCGWKWLKIHFILLYAIFEYIQFKMHDTMHKNL